MVRVWETQRVTSNSSVLGQIRRSKLESVQESYFAQLEDRNGKRGRAGNKLRTYRIVKRKKIICNGKLLTLSDIPAHLERALTQIRTGAQSRNRQRKES